MPPLDENPTDRPAELDHLPPVEPGDLLEERVVRALRAEGLLEAALPRAHPSYRGPSRALAPAWIVAAAAAGLALFLGGYAVGQHHGTAVAADLFEPLVYADAGERAALVQRTSSLWVGALTALADAAVASGDAATVAAGREAARAGLRAAARELGRLEPDDARLAWALDALAAGTGAEPGEPTARRTILWF